jgi:hypothetical protein
MRLSWQPLHAIAASQNSGWNSTAPTAFCPPALPPYTPTRVTSYHGYFAATAWCHRIRSGKPASAGEETRQRRT